MDALRTDLRIRIAAVFEWTVAGLFLCATIAVGALILKALVTPLRPAAPELVPTGVAAPPSLPAGAERVSELSLGEGRLLRPGAPLADVAAWLGRSAETGRQDVDQGRFGERLTRFYERDGIRFALVFELPEPDREPLLEAIYIIR